MKKKTKKYLKRMIRADFDGVKQFEFGRLDKCIKVAYDLGFKKLAKEMTNDLTI
jgi:hypothetical protein